jgi:hypothetical protein
MIASAGEVWRVRGRHGDPDRPRPDPAGPEVTEARWVAELDVARLRAILTEAGLRGSRLDDFAAVERGPSGRVRLLRVSGFHPDTIDAEVFRVVSGRVAGWHLVKSTWFDVERTAAGYRLTGRGHGHGVGLCVRGAVALGTALDAAAILDAYFPGTRVVVPERARAASATDGSVQSRPAMLSQAGTFRLVLPAAAESRRSDLAARIRSATDAIASRLGEPLPRKLTIRFHPTVESYQRATGRPWWTAGAFRDDRVDLLPPDVLERHGYLDRTIQHELVHAMTAPVLADAPLWVREGVAHYFSAPAGIWTQHGSEEPCPDDGTMAGATSAEALRTLYERSASCVGVRLARGRTWRNLP